MGTYATELSWLAAWQLGEVLFEVLFEMFGEEFGRADLVVILRSPRKACLITVGIDGDIGRGQVLQR